MKYKEFVPFLMELNVRNLSLLFEAYKWILVDEFSNANFRVYFKYVNDNKIEVLIPKADTNKKKGYIQIVLDAVETFSIIEGFTIKEIINKLASPNSNIVNIRYIKSNDNSSLIPGNVFVSMIENAKKMYVHSFLDLNLDTRKKYRRGRLSKDADNILNNLYFGQTEIGSYILPMYLPKGVSNENDLLDYIGLEDNLVLENSNETKAITKMFESINVIKDKIDSNESLDELLNVDNDNFVSINFIDAVSELGIYDTSTRIEFSVDSNSLKRDVVTSPAISIQSKYTSKMKEFANEYKKNMEAETEIIGRLYKVGTQPDVLDRELISVKIKGLSKSNKEVTRICEFRFDEEIQHIIFDAFERGVLIRVNGEPERKKLLNCSIEVLN